MLSADSRKRMEASDLRRLATPEPGRVSRDAVGKNTLEPVVGRRYLSDVAKRNYHPSTRGASTENQRKRPGSNGATTLRFARPAVAGGT